MRRRPERWWLLGLLFVPLFAAAWAYAAVESGGYNFFPGVNVTGTGSGKVGVFVPTNSCYSLTGQTTSGGTTCTSYTHLTYDGTSTYLKAGSTSVWVATDTGDFTVTGDINLGGNDLTGTGDAMFIITGNASSSTVTGTNPAVVIRAGQALGAGDLVLAVRNSVGNNRFTVDHGGNSFVGGTLSITDTATSQVGSGSNAFAVATNGARIDFGAGANDYASSDGTTVTTGGAWTFGGNVSAGANSVTANGGFIGSGTNTFSGATPLNLSGAAANVFFSNTAATGGLITSSMSAANASSSNAIIRITSQPGLDANDLMFAVLTGVAGAGGNVFSVDYEGDIFGTSASLSGAGVTLTGATSALTFNNAAATSGSIVSTMSAANASSSNAIVRLFSQDGLDAGDLMFAARTGAAGSGGNVFTVDYEGDTVAASYSIGTEKVPTFHSSTQKAIESGSAAMTSGELAVTFNTAFSLAPHCVCTHVNTTNGNACNIKSGSVPTTTAVTFAVASGGSDVVEWHCIGNK